jgi:hypothetical protein
MRKREGQCKILHGSAVSHMDLSYIHGIVRLTRVHRAAVRALMASGRLGNQLNAVPFADVPVPPLPRAFRNVDRPRQIGVGSLQKARQNCPCPRLTLSFLFCFREILFTREQAIVRSSAEGAPGVYQHAQCIAAAQIQCSPAIISCLLVCAPVTTDIERSPLTLPLI